MKDRIPCSLGDLDGFPATAERELNRAILRFQDLYMLALDGGAPSKHELERVAARCAPPVCTCSMVARTCARAFEQRSAEQRRARRASPRPAGRRSKAETARERRRTVTRCLMRPKMKAKKKRPPEAKPLPVRAKFFRASFYEGTDPHRDTDETAVRLCLLVIEHGWCVCPSCGGQGTHPRMVTTLQRRKYSYALCDNCYRSANGQGAPWSPADCKSVQRIEAVGAPVHTEPVLMRGPIAERVEKAFDAFIDAGEPAPDVGPANVVQLFKEKAEQEP